VSAYAAGFDGKLVLLGDDEMALTDCRVDWPDGGTERNLDRLWRDIDDAIARTLARGTPVTDGDEGAPDAATPPDAPADNPATTAH
jgi:flagellar assembly protein FliH